MSTNLTILSASETNNNLHHLAFDNSLQANIITRAISGQLIMANRAACKLLGYSKKELLTKSRSAIFDINERSFKKMLQQRTAEGHSIATVTALTKKGKLIPCEISSAVFMDKDGIKKAITTISDLRPGILKQKNIDTEKEKIVAENISIAKTKQKKIDIKKEKIVADNIILALTKSDEEKLEQDIHAREKVITEYEENFRLIFNLSSDVLYDVDQLTGEVTLNDEYEKEFGYKITGNMMLTEDWFNHIHPGDKKAVMKDYRRMLASSDVEWKSSFRFFRADNSVANIVTRCIVLRDSNQKAFRRIGYMQDISKQIKLDEKLELEIKLKEFQIAEALEDAKDAERSDIGKELHDNVNQLLGASKLYLDMAKRGGPQSETYLSRSSEYTLSAIEEIRKLTKGLTTDIIKNLGLREAIENIAHDTMEIHAVKISCALDSFIERSVKDKFKLNIFRIIQEQMNNILKHAKATLVSISLLQNKNDIRLIITDNGVGFDTGKKRTGIGIDNIKSRATTYNGTADFVSQTRKGCALTITFPLTDALLNQH